MACDICGDIEKDLEDLMEDFKTSDIKNVCHDCERVLHKKYHKLLSMTRKMNIHFVKIFMKNLRSAKS